MKKPSLQQVVTALGSLHDYQERDAKNAETYRVAIAAIIWTAGLVGTDWDCPVWLRCHLNGEAAAALADAERRMRELAAQATSG